MSAELRVAVAADPVGPGGRLQALTPDGAPDGPARHVTDLGAALADREARDQPRWVWAATDDLYPRLLDRLPRRLARCHDLALAETLLLGHEEAHGHPRSLGAAWARLHGLPVPADPAEPGPGDQPQLFAPDRHRLPPGTDHLDAVVAVHAAQQHRLDRAAHPARLRLLAAAESAGALAAAEMTHDGLPWNAAAHDRLLTGLLGPRPAGGAAPRALAELAARIQDAFGHPVNPDSPAQLIQAFARAGVRLDSTRSHLLREVGHPAAPLVLRYKELSRVHAAHGWAWREQWAPDGRFRPEYVVGGVVSGRWATRGGGALQIPRQLRAAVVAEPGHRLVVADAGQLEPRVLAALSADPGLAAAAQSGDLYAALARTAFHGDRQRAKIGLLAAMYGQTSGEAGRLVAVLRARFPAAMELVESAARTGEQGGTVRSRLGRTCPAPTAGWADGDVAERDASPDARRAARSWGRFTRNFVIQASAADWALAVLAALRRRLAALPPAADGGAARLVFFQHDEVIVHASAESAERVRAEVTAAAEEARRLVFGATPVPFPLESAIVECYADAKGAGEPAPAAGAGTGAGA
jgi:DNA polymerase-1